MSAVGPGAFLRIFERYLPEPVVGHAARDGDTLFGTSENLIVLFG